MEQEKPGTHKTAARHTPRAASSRRCLSAPRALLAPENLTVPALPALRSNAVLAGKTKPAPPEKWASGETIFRRARDG